ncbi:hypothetical protein D9758_008107 [Tetrapyrgos nigripes]|uniref:Uncharacterized protein n=1 Tax=Tetrapyrgos nigripes TaxID=182062 RepID=A0A8H5GHH8_9AGAR|nr:hypothetical protein D9758_008107 [Tetrapyrgos nigripes]
MSDRQTRPRLPVHSTETPHRTSRPLRKYCLWFSGFIVLTVSAYYLPSVYTFMHTVYRGNAYPQQFLYQNQTLSEVSNRSLVIQPLIDNDQTFDVAVSVWIRGTEAEELKWRASQEGSDEDYQKLRVMSWHDGEDILNDRKQLYYPLYSDIAFRGLRLSDKNKYASINFTLPTEKFREHRLPTNTLIATFVLIPTSPSLMDSVVNYSSYIPEEVWSKAPAVRTWPFPMGSEYTGEKTLADLALESFSLQTSLIQYHHIPFRCPDGNETATADNVLDELSSFKDGIINDHPHVTTWSQLRVVDETHIMNLQAYNELHEDLKTRSCGRGFRDLKPLRRYCKSPYLETGNLETRLELEMKDSQGTHTEWAYAPYMTVFDSASGPMDLVPVPVHRENCTGKTIVEQKFNFTESDTMDITWHITFSGRSPTKLQIGNTATPHTVNHRQSDYEKIVAQDKAELSNGFYGMRKPGSHPRRRMVLSFLSASLTVVIAILESIYWFFRSSTIHISIPGTVLLGLEEILGVVQVLVSTYAPLSGPFPSAPYIMESAVFSSPSLPLAYWMLRTVLRIELVWKGGLPTFRRRSASHSERASERLDATMSWTARISILSTLFLCFYFLRDYMDLLPAVNPAPDSKESRINYLLAACVHSFWFTGYLSQIILNYKSGHYAGSYKSAMYLMWFKKALFFLDYVPAVVGRYQTKPALWLPSIISWFVQSVLVYQSITLPAVSTVEGHEDEE